MVSLCCDTQEKDLNFLRKRTLELAQGSAGGIHKTAVGRDMQASDIGYPNDLFVKDMSAGTPLAWNTLTSFTVPDNTYIGFGSIFDLSDTPVVWKVKLGNASCVFRQFDLHAMHAQCEAHRVLDQTEQIIFGPGTNVDIEVYLSAASDSVKIGFDGEIGEPAGLHISYSPLIDP